MHAFVLKGSAASVMWGYHNAADLTSWEYDGTTLRATVVTSDAFAVSQQPLTFVVDRPSGHVWKWPVLSLQIAGTTLTASLSQE